MVQDRAISISTIKLDEAITPCALAEKPIMSDYIGRQFGNYQIVRKLARGSFGTVYLAEHLHLETLAAIKILHTPTELDARARDKFLYEARVNAHLQHPHIIHIIDFGFDGPTPYMVMDYVPNGTLRMLHPRGTCVSERQIISYVHQIASALNYAHEQRVIHRDIKPENILLNSKQELVLSDFGIAVVQPTLDSFSTQSPSGTPVYMAPEQIRGKPCAASDQYAVGVMVYEWLCGEPPFNGPNMAVFVKHLYDPPPSLCARLPHLLPAVEDTVLGALAKNPQHRFLCVQDFAIALEEAFWATQPISSSISVEYGIQDQITHPLLDARLVSMMNEPAPTDGDSTQPRLKVIRRSEEQQAPVSLRQFHVPTSALHNQNRQRLLKRVHSFWIAGMLEQSLHGAALLALGLQARPDAVANPWHLVLQNPDMPTHPLPAETRITEVYDASDGELLILGAPGSGKTTLLLELARDLLLRAEHDENHPVPVVFNLSSWSLRQQRLTAWLVEELNSKYQVPRKLGQTLVDADQILPLLDGLDEVAPKSRTACIEAVNSYREEHGFLPLVVCSRIADYLEQNTRVLLRNAVTVQPLTEAQVNAYLKSGGEPLKALSVALQQDAALHELTRSPLMLSILTLTYHDKPVEELLQRVSATDRQRQVFEHYVTRMLQRSDRNCHRYSSSQTVQRLSWLARQLSQRNQTVFYIEHMQPDWLSGRFLRWLYMALAVKPIDAFVGLLVGFLGSFLVPGYITSGMVSAPIYALIGLMVGLLTPRGYPIRTPANSRAQALWKYVRIGPILAGLVMTEQHKRREYAQCQVRIGPILAGLVMTPLAGFFVQGVTDLSEIAKSAWLGAWIGLAIGALLCLRSTSIQPIEIVSWSWCRFIQVKHLYTGLLVGLSVGLLDWWFFPTIYVLIYALFWSAGGWLVCGLLSGFSNERLDNRHRIVPNQGIRYSARNGLRLGLLGGLSSGLIVALAFRLFYGYVQFDQAYAGLYTIVYGVASALGVGLLIWLFSGSDASIKHRVLRCFLSIAGVIPWRFSRFLDYAAECILLCRVGGGYIFTHRLLLDYFASLGKTTLRKQQSIRLYTKE